MTFHKYHLGTQRPRMCIFKGSRPMFLWLAFCLLGLSYHAVIHAWPESAMAAEPEVAWTYESKDVWIDLTDQPDGKGGDDWKTFTAVRTRYSRADSCHNPSGKKCLTAAGRDTQEGVTVACPRYLKLGTRVTLSDAPDHVYVCEDRYSQRLDGERGMPTIDVFAEAGNLDKIPSRKIVTVTVIN
jgi:hypothetical protein